MASPLRNDLLSQASIHYGVWTNWNKGSVQGLTLTTTSAGGAVLIAFLAIFVQITGNYSWGILRFVLHQSRVDIHPRDALYHQQQAVLRNLSSADSAVGLLRLGWAWRKITQSPVFSSLPLSLAAIVHLSAFLVAAIFSASASTSSGDEILVSSPDCGLVSGDTANLSAFQTVIYPYNVKSIEDSANYARSCYSSNGSSERAINWHDCSTYTIPRLPSQQTANITCPFAANICTAPSYQLDTGLIDSLHFGMNAPRKDRVMYRKVSTCAPTAVDGFSEIKKGSSISSNYTRLTDIPELEYVELNYGPILYHSVNGAALSNYTYRFHSFLIDFKYEEEGQFPDEFDYFLSYVSTKSGFKPIPQIYQGNTDTILVFLSQNSVVYVSPVDDPWFAAHSNSIEVTANASDFGDPEQATQHGSIYFRDRPVSVLGCVEQYQMCNPHMSADDRCTPLVSAYQLYDAVIDLQLSTAQNATAYALVDASQSISIGDVVEALGNSALLARQSYFGDIQGPLPPYQWTLEVESWVNIVLAQLQRAALERATGPANTELLPFLYRPTTAAEKAICLNQMVRSSDAQNFSVLAIIIILVLGSLIICVDLFLDSIVGCFQRRRNAFSYRRLAWKTNNLLQLQRLAHEESGFGDWAGCVNQVPVTGPGQSLAGLDIEDPEHPKLQKKQMCGPQQRPAATSAESSDLILKGPTVQSLEGSKTAPSAGNSVLMPSVPVLTALSSDTRIAPIRTTTSASSDTPSPSRRHSF